MEEYTILMLGPGMYMSSCSHLATRFAEGYPAMGYLESNLLEREVFIESKPVKLKFTDLGDTEQFNSIRDILIKDCQGCVFVYSGLEIFDKVSEMNEVRYFIYDKKGLDRGHDILPSVLVGTVESEFNSHLESYRRVYREKGEELAREWGCPFYEASAETGHNVEEVFMDVAHQIHQMKSKSEVKAPAISAKEKRLRHKRAYKKAIRGKFTLNIRPVRFNHIGLPRSGKSSFMRRIMGEILNILMAGEEFQRSTGIAEAGGQAFIRSMCTSLGTIQSKVWDILKDFGEEACMLNQFIFQAVEESHSTYSADSTPAKPVRPVRPSPSKPYVPEGGASFKTKRSMWKNFLSLFDKESSGKAPSKKDMEETFSVIDEAMKDDEWDKVKYLLEDLILLINTDTGGQAEFLDMQASLVLGPSLNLLYRRLVDDLDSQYKTYYTSEEGKSTEQEDSTTTVEETLFQTLASIACFGIAFCDGDDTTDDKLPGHSQSKAIFVGTHRDLVTEEDFKRKDRELQRKVRNTEFYGKGIIEFVSDEQLMLAVDNMSGDQGEIDSTRKLLVKIIERSFERVAIPASWLMLSLCIRKSGVRTMSLAECEKLAGKLRISAQDLQHALWFLHHYIGVLLHYPDIESLRDTVICDIQVVYDSASNLIKNTFTFDKVGHQISQKFKEKAQFSLRDMKKATSGQTDDLLPLEKLVDLLEDRNVLTVVPPVPASRGGSTSTTTQEPTYFMPCVLHSAQADELVVSDHCDSDPPSLMLRFNCGYVPIGVFPAMITNLVSQQREDWEMIVRGLRKNRVQFNVGVDKVTLIAHPRFLEIVVTKRASFATPTESLCSHVRSVIQSTLDTVTSHLNYHFRMQYRFGFECPIHPGRPREHICILPKESADNLECLKDPQSKEPVHIEPRHMVWFSRNACAHSALFSSATSCPEMHQSKSPLRPTQVSADCNTASLKQVPSMFNPSQPDGHKSPQGEESFSTSDTPKELASCLVEKKEAPKDIDCTPTLIDLITFPMSNGGKVNLAEEIGVNYYNFGLLLLEDKDGNQMSAIEREQMRNAPEIVRHTFRLWLQGKGRQPVTWATLVAVLQDTGLIKLANDIECVKLQI